MFKPGDVAMHTRLRAVIRVENIWPDGQIYGVDTNGAERRWRTADCQVVDDDPSASGVRKRAMVASFQN
ncbi:MAG: hypothetical protein ACR2IE_17875 [Candidatus Sumerlaeaceae bacterium]